jgi:hypothetical protein
MIILGSATITPAGVVIDTNDVAGFNTVTGVRLSNYSGDVITLQNISGQDQSEEYLMPLQQMVYPSANIRNIPVLKALSLGNAIVVETVLVEWSTDPLNDFQGTYPVALTEVGTVFLTPENNPAVSAGEVLLLPTANTTETIPGYVFRHSITVINNGTTNIAWSTDPTGRGDWSTQAVILPGSSRTLNSGVTLYFQSDADGGTLEWFSD